VLTFRMDQQTPKGLRWGEFLLGIGFVLVNIGAGFVGGREGTQFYSRFWFAWMTFAAFVGMTLLLILTVRDLRVLGHVSVSLVILAGIGFCLLDQHFFASPGIKNWSFNLIAIIGLIACMKANRHFAAHVRLFVVPLTVITLCVTLFWALGSPCQIFLPVLFMPVEKLSAARSTFTLAFFSGMFASFLICAAIAFLGQRQPALQERTSVFENPISGKTKIRMALGLLAFIVIAVPTFYFLPGTSSGSGGVPVEFFRGDRPAQTRVSVEEVDRYLREIGFEPSDGKAFLLRPKGSPVAWFRYPLSKSRAVELCLWPDPERSGALVLSYRYDRVSVFESGKVRKLMAAIRRHFPLRAQAPWT